MCFSRPGSHFHHAFCTQLLQSQQPRIQVTHAADATSSWPLPVSRRVRFTHHFERQPVFHRSTANLQSKGVFRTRLVSWPPGCDKVIDSLVQIQVSNVGLGLSHFCVSSVQEIIDHNPVVPPAKVRLDTDHVGSGWSHSVRPSVWSAPRVMHGNLSCVGFLQDCLATRCDSEHCLAPFYGTKLLFDSDEPVCPASLFASYASEQCATSCLSVHHASAHASADKHVTSASGYSKQRHFPLGNLRRSTWASQSS